MLQIIIHAISTIVCLLVIFLAYRLYKLNQQYSDTTHLNATDDPTSLAAENNDKTLYTAAHYSNKTETLKLAQKFTAAQANDVKNNDALKRFLEDDWLNDISHLYIMSAVNYICEHTNCDNKSKKEITQLALKSNKIKASKGAVEYFNEHSEKQFDESDRNAISIGEDAAHNWLATGTVPKESSLNEHLAWTRLESLTTHIEKKMAQV